MPRPPNKQLLAASVSETSANPAACCPPAPQALGLGVNGEGLMRHMQTLAELPIEDPNFGDLTTPTTFPPTLSRTGLGMNGEELARNKQLTEFSVKDPSRPGPTAQPPVCSSALPSLHRPGHELGRMGRSWRANAAH